MKYRLPFFFTFSDNTLKNTNSYINSTIDCHAFGTNLALKQAKLNIKKPSKQLIIVNKLEFVKERSIRPKLTEKSLIIANCSNGDMKNIKI